MTRKTTKRGQSPLCLLLMGSAASAQQAVIDHCQQTSSDADRIACLEAALLGKRSPATATIPASEPAIVAAEEVTPVAEPSSADVATEVVPEGIGAEQVISRNETREEMLEKLEKESGLVVAKYDTVPYQKLQVTLENGQVWRQITGDTQILRVDLKRNQTVDIEESSISGYKLHLNEMRRTVRVERVK